MRARSRLKHSVAGLLGHLISRNNDVSGYWGPGLLYKDVNASPHIIELNLLTGESGPGSESGVKMAANAAVFLRAALEKNAFEWCKLTRATITFTFNATVSDPRFYFPCAGDPFICTVALQLDCGLNAVASAQGRCYPYRHWAFSQRAG